MDSDKRIFMLVAGVGAGKNYWVKTLTESGHEDKGYKSSGYKVLLITSRRATVDAQTIKLDADQNFHFSELYDDDNWWGEAPPGQKVVCCTNSYIAYYAKHLYDPDNPKTHVWNMFDFIILDEAHSLACDATFSDAPFYVQTFLRYAHSHGKNCRIIMMSGTPEPIKWLYDGNNRDQVSLIDLRKKCRNIGPQKVIIRPRENLATDIVKKLNKGNRIIYFATTTDNMRDIIEEIKVLGIPLDDIGIAYSEDPNKDAKFDTELVEKRGRIQASLAEKEIVPTDVKILFSTSKNKEGININDPDIKDMIVESHQCDEVRQMAGRVRKGLTYLVIINDAKQHLSNRNQFLRKIDTKCVDAINKAATEYWAKDIRCKAENIIQVEERHRYIRYDVFSEKFRSYTGRSIGDALSERDEKNFSKYLALSDDPSFMNGNPGWDYFVGWFPNAKLSMYSAMSLKEAVAELLNEAKLLNVQITKAQLDAIMEDVRHLVKNHNQHDTDIKADFVKYKPVLKKLGYNLKEADGVRKNTIFIISKM